LALCQRARAPNHNEPSSGVSVLITGASGFIGRPVLAELAQSGEQIDAVYAHAEPPALDGVCWHRLDLADSGATERLIESIRPQRLVHLAWYVEPGRFWGSPENVLWVERSLALLRAFARAGGRRAFMLGTCAEYDWRDPQSPLREESSPLAPATPYGTAKDELRRAAADFAEREGIEFTWGRLFFPYGPGENVARLVPSIVLPLLAGESVATTSGEQVRDFIHVDDVGRAIAAIAFSSIGGAINIGSGEGVQVRSLVDAIAAQIGRPELVRRGELAMREGDPPAIVAGVDKLREIGFQPRLTLAEGLARTLAWWRVRAQQR
jgi:nucleoside-diphosphate-sugar epimerase